MRLLLILVGALLATVSANPVELEADLEEDDTGLDIEDVGEDLGQILQGLFDARDPRDVEEETEEEAEEADEDSESVEEKEEEQVISPQEVARFNNYMDAIYRRMNAALRAKMMDPMTLNLNQKVKKEEKSEKTNHREVREAEEEDEVEEVDDEEDEDEQEVESVDRMGKLSKKKGKGKKGKKGSKVEKDKKEKKGKNKGQKDKRMNKNDKKKSKLTREERLKKKADRKKKQEDKKKNKTNKGVDREERSGNKKGNKHNKKHSKAQKENKNKGHGKGKGKGKNHKGNKARDGKDKEEGPAMGSLSGMATLRRDGDVQIKNAENHKVVKSTFSVGPLSLEVSKKYGSGKARTVRTARAKTAVMQGVMQLKVKEDGSAHILSVVFKKPEDVAVSGSISDNRKRSDNFVKNSVNKMRPLAAQKILKTARYVLKAPHSKKTE